MARSEKDDVVKPFARKNEDSSSSSEAASQNASQGKDDPQGSSLPIDGADEFSCESRASEVAEKEAASTDDKKDSVSSDVFIAKAQEEAEEWKSKYLRLHAEWDTYRRRMSEQRLEEKAVATEKLVEHLLPVIDDFERTIDYAEKNGETGLLGGVQAVHTKLLDSLKKEGVEVVNPQGEAFDALECQAVSVVEDGTILDETVSEVFQKGYKMGKKVLRSAMVSVTTGGPKREVLQEEE